MMPVAVSLCPQASDQVPQQAGTSCSTPIGLARTMPANFSPFPRNGTGKQEFPLLHPHVFACTGETHFYEGCIGKGADLNPPALSGLTVSPDTQVGLPKEKWKWNGGEKKKKKILVYISKGLYKLWILQESEITLVCSKWYQLSPLCLSTTNLGRKVSLCVTEIKTVQRRWKLGQKEARLPPTLKKTHLSKHTSRKSKSVSVKPGLSQQQVMGDFCPSSS